MAAVQSIAGGLNRMADAYVQKKLQAPQVNGTSNLYQLVDKADISPEAKHQLDATLMKQGLQLAAGGNKLTSAQHNFVFDGSVYTALSRLDSGKGSLQDVTAALQARGQRLTAVENGTAPILPVTTPPQPSNPPSAVNPPQTTPTTSTAA